MPIDSFFTAALAHELDEKLRGCRIEKIYMPSKDEIVLSLRGYGYAVKLLLNVCSGASRVMLTERAYENPAKPPMFCMLLRKHISGGKILSVTQPAFDRVIAIEVECVDELFDISAKKLIVELTGRSSNLILLSPEGRVIDAIRKNDLTSNCERLIMCGMLYNLPPTGDKTDIVGADADIDERLRNNTKDLPLDSYLMNSFGGLSPLAAREIAYKAVGDHTLTMQTLNGLQRERLEQEIKAFAKSVKEKNFTPVMLSDGHDKPFDLSCFDVLQYGEKYKKRYFDSPSQLAEEFYSVKDKKEKKKQISSELMKKVTVLRDRAAKKLAFQQQDLDKSLDREHLRIYGELLQANIMNIPKGAPFFIAENFYDEMKEIRIPLDIAKSAQWNIQNYFKKYQKARSAEKMLTEQIENTKREITYLESVINSIEQAENERDISEITAELVSARLIRSSGEKKAKKPASRGFAIFESTDGFVILAGKNNSQNEELSLRVAEKTDIWLHAENIPGSHVVIIGEGNTPTDKTLEEAAIIAACMSKAKAAGKVPVQYTEVKLLKKPSGTPPGFVTFSRYKTVYVTPDEQLFNKLRKQ